MSINIERLLSSKKRYNKKQIGKLKEEIRLEKIVYTKTLESYNKSLSKVKKAWEERHCLGSDKEVSDMYEKEIEKWKQNIFRIEVTLKDLDKLIDRLLPVIEIKAINTIEGYSYHIDYSDDIIKFNYKDNVTGQILCTIIYSSDCLKIRRAMIHVPEWFILSRYPELSIIEI
jgi:hypothetical protein